MRYISTMLLLLVCAVCFAQTGGIQGTIRTADDQPAAFIDVFLMNTDKVTSTDKQGNYQFRNLQPGTYSVFVSLTTGGIQERTVDVEAGQKTEANIVLSQKARELEEVVVSTSTKKYKEDDPSQSLRLMTPILEVPQNIQVVTSDVLKNQQVISMSDGLVRNVSGLVRMEHWGDMYTNISARGNQIQAFRNGMNVVNSYWGPLTEDMSFVESIEFVKGPAGFMVSSGDPSGLYNVVTKKPTGQTKGEATLTLGSFNLYRAALDLDGKLSKDGRLLYRFNTAAQQRASFRPNEFNDRYTFAPVVSYQVDDKTKLTFEYTYQRANMSDVGSYYVFTPKGYGVLPREFTMNYAGSPTTHINDHSAYLNLQHNINSDWKVTAQVARFLYDQEGTSSWPWAVNDSTVIRGQGIWDAKSKMTMGQAFLNGEFMTGSVRHRILAGVDMTNKLYLADWFQSHPLDTINGGEFQLDSANLGVPPNGFPEFDRSKSLEERAYAGGGVQDQAYSSIYLQDELGFMDGKVRLTLAGRFTNIRQSYAGTGSEAKHFTPRAGISVSLDKYTSVYAMYDQAFIPQGGRLTSGKKVQPITGNNMEIGVKRDWFGGRWFTGLTAYRIIKNNELTGDPNTNPALGFSVELGQKVSQGVEFDVRGTITRGLTLIANYAFTESKVLKVTEGVTALKEGDLVPGYSTHTANMWLTYRLQSGALRGLGVNLGGSFLGNRVTYWDPSPAGGAVLEDYFRMDGGISWESKRLTLTANVFNLLDEYLYSGSYYTWLNAYYWQAEAPRNLRFSVAYRF